MIYTPRYSVCTPGDLPRELLSTNSRTAALADCAARCAAGEPAVVYDWTDTSQVTA